jgi:UDP-N-acetylglucosamine 4-epimerase
MIVASRDAGVKRFVYAASSSTYGDSESLPKVEDVIGKPLSPYAITKYVGELYADVFAKTYDMECIGLRYFNVFGNRMTNEGAYKSVISIFREQKVNNQPLTLTNDGNQRRDFVYVGDVVKANYLSCIEDTGDFEIFNVGYGTNISVNEIASYFNQPTTYIGERIEPFETLSSTKKIETVLNWKPTVSVKEFLNKTI